MEGLRDVGRRELDDDLFPALGGVLGVDESLVSIGTKGLLRFQNLSNDSLCKSVRPEEELEVRAERDGREDEVRFGKFFGEFLAKVIGLLPLDLQRRDLYFQIMN
jgi:hypothetical protein